MLGVSRRNAPPRDDVRASFRHQIGRVQQRFEGPRVGPPTVENAVSQGSLSQIHVIDVGDFQFIAMAGFGLADFLEYRGVVEVNTGDGEVGLRSFGFFLDSKYLAVGNLRAAKALRVWQFFQ